MIEELILIVVAVATGSVIGAWLNSKLLPRGVVQNIHKAAQSETLWTILNRRAEELGASFVRGARREMKGRFDHLDIPILEEAPQT